MIAERGFSAILLIVLEPLSDSALVDRESLPGVIILSQIVQIRCQGFNFGLKQCGEHDYFANQCRELRRDRAKHAHREFVIL